MSLITLIIKQHSAMRRVINHLTLKYIGHHMASKALLYDTQYAVNVLKGKISLTFKVICNHLIIHLILSG